ncbi:uncharacterized protein C2orf66 homolog [Eublepharis macularius]|uniref:Uncharacterized protein C2orf66 homolog n=1 Tax=Eublepharis macularius TaxID=481883 RepID=A0AA97IVD0_EUBMA|nr:uncharacterized protein C2orf66 homolog [Eublepharis macularius]
MWKLVILIQCTALILRGVEQAASLQPEETWKPLDNPRNRDLFFRTLKTYFSGRGLDLRKFPDTLSKNSEKPRPVSFYLDPVTSAFADSEEQRNTFANYHKG